MPPYRTRQWSSLTSKPFQFLPSLLLALMVLGATGQAAVLRMLFIGNSHTYGHNVPQIVADIAQFAGERPLEPQAAHLMQELAWNTVQRLR